MKPITDLLNFSLINIDKPKGPTSYSVSEFIKRQFGLKKTSHMGTLDPKATGVLPVTLGRACKLAEYFIKHDKSYVGILHIHKEQDIKKLQKLIDDNFVGKIKQTPPHRSAVKVEERVREVYNWTLIEASENKRDFLFQCKVEGGTYIRKLCSDLGEIINGAHMGELRRTEAGIFSEKTAVNLFDFKSAVDKYKNGLMPKSVPPIQMTSADADNIGKNLWKMLIPAEDAIKKVLPFVKVEKKTIKSLYIGRPLFRDSTVGDIGDIKTNDKFAVFCGNQFIGVYRRTTEKLIFGRSEFVFN